jgi:heme oxygenase
MMNTALLRQQLNNATRSFIQRGEAWPAQLQEASEALQRIENFSADLSRFQDDYDTALEKIAKLLDANPWLAERKRAQTWIKGESFACWNYGVETNDTHPDLEIRNQARRNLDAIENFVKLGGSLYTAQANIDRLKNYLDAALMQWGRLWKEAA